MPKDIIIKSDASNTSLSVNGNIYDLISAPETQDPLVVRETKELLAQIDLNDLNDNLYLSVELLNVAYNGVAGAEGGKLQKDINDLMGDFALLCNKCVGTMQTFQSSSENIVRELGRTYKWLIAGKEKLAISKLRHCGESSHDMSVAADELSTDFKELQKRSVAIRSNTILAEASEHDKQLAAQKAIRELEAKQKAEKVNQTELVAQVTEVQELFDDAKSREEKAAKKSLILGIVSAITGAIGAGLGAFAAAKNPIGTVVSASAQNQASQEQKDKLDKAQKDAESKKTKSEEANKKLLEITSRLIPAENKVKGLNKEKKAIAEDIKIIKGVKEDDRTDEQKSKLDELQSKLTDKEKEINDAQVNVDQIKAEKKSAQSTAKDLTAAYGAAASALDKLSGSMNQMAAAASSAEESIHQEKMKFLNKKFELQAEKRKSLVAMAEFAESIKNAEIVKGNTTVSVNSLHAAVEALGKIVGTLTNASLFWKQMATFCDRMTSQGFQSDLSDLTDPENDISKEERIQEYTNEFFMMTFLKYMCQWIALNGLSSEYLVNADRAQKKLLEHISSSPTIEEAQRNAPALAKSMGVLISKKIEISTRQSTEILQEQARIKNASTKNPVLT